MTAAQLMLLDILTDKLITIGSTIKRIRDMTEEQVENEIKTWDVERAAAMDELNQH